MRIERIWAMPNKNTFEIKPIKELLTEEITNGLWVDPFANEVNSHPSLMTLTLNLIQIII